MAAWKDITSHQRGDKQREPRSFELRIGDLRVVVTRRIHLDGWWLNAYPIGIDGIELRSTDVEAAKREALRFVESELSRWLRGIRSTPAHPEEGSGSDAG